MDILIYNHLLQKKIVIPQKRGSQKSDKYVGAYVKDSQVGQHKWVLSFDLNSLYPHLIMQYNLSPETLLDLGMDDFYQGLEDGLNVDYLLSGKKILFDLKERNITLTPNCAFSKDKQGFLPEMMQSMYNDRTVYKKKMLRAKQQYEDTKDAKYLKEISRYNNIQMKKDFTKLFYGAIGNEWFRYYDLRIAEGITT